MATIHTLYIVSLFGICVLVLGKWAWTALFQMEPMRRTALVLLANWTANTAFVIASGIYDPWWFLIVTDALSARLILHRPAGRQQSVIGWFYMTQIIVHCVYGVSNPAVAAQPYWLLLTGLAFCQLVVLGGWGAGRAYHSWHRRHSRLARSSRDESVA